MHFLILAAALTSGSALAADIDYAQKIGRLDGRVVDAEAKLSRVAEDIEQRRGFIGAGEARERFENAVYSFLVGDYGRAAKAFFILVESRALTAAELQTDAEWYLAECLFEMGNVALAEEAFQRVIEQGPRHPFFADGVRRQLELYGITGDADKFYALYNAYIVPGRVAPTDAVKYTLAKSFYRQEELARAKGLLLEIGPDSLFFAKARYVLGTVLVVEGSYDESLSEFEMAADVAIPSSEVQEVVDLANLALGRLHYELGNFVESSTYYQRIGRDSSYFADALYEIGWTFIKDRDFEQALQSVEIFLLAFPEHRYAPRLKLLKGHLHMKEIAYESALSDFERVIDEYTGVHGDLADMGSRQTLAAEWFRALADLEDTDLGELGGGGFSNYDLHASELPTGDSGDPLPRFAVEMLLAEQEVERSLDVYRELKRQEQDIADAKALIRELEDALVGGANSLGSFQKARVDLDSLRADGFLVMSEILEIEEAWLLNNAEAGDVSSELRELQDRREDLSMELAELQSDERSEDDRMAAYDEQVRAVQSRAFRVEQMVRDLQAQAESLRGQLTTGEHKLSDYESGEIKSQLSEVEGDLDEAIALLNRLQSEATRQQVLAPVAQVGASPEKSDLTARVLTELTTLRKRYKRYRSKVSGDDKTLVLGGLDQLWARVESLEKGVASNRGRLDSSERSELASVRSRLALETGEVVLERRALVSQLTEADQLSASITATGFTTIAGNMSETVELADRGIVDVYWLRKVEVSDEKQGLLQERAALNQELNERFRIVRQGLEE